MPTVTEHPPIVKQEFRCPAEVLEKQRELKGIVTPQIPLTVSATPLVGTWVNCDHATPSLAKLVIATKGAEITIHAYGACTPTPCDMGTIDGKVYADSVVNAPAVSFTADYKFSFKETIMTGHLFQGVLFVESFNHFTDNSGRADYYHLDIMSK